MNAVDVGRGGGRGRKDQGARGGLTANDIAVGNAVAFLEQEGGKGAGRGGSRSGNASHADRRHRVVVHVRRGSGDDSVEQDADELGSGSCSGQGVGAGLRVGSEADDVAGDGEALRSAGGGRVADVHRGVQRSGCPGAGAGLVEPVVGDRPGIAAAEGRDARAGHRRGEVVEDVVVVDDDAAVADRGGGRRAVAQDRLGGQVRAGRADVVVRDRIVVVAVGRHGVGGKEIVPPLVATDDGLEP